MIDLTIKVKVKEVIDFYPPKKKMSCYELWHIKY